jgi:hypothetical protein
VIIMELAELLDRTGLDVLDHLERQTTIPVLDGLQAQGDLIVIPWALLTVVTTRTFGTWLPVTANGVELVRGADGNNPHTLVADPGTCRWTADLRDPLGLGIAVFENTAAAYLIHPEHGGSGVAPGRWLVRRQQERGSGPRGRSVLIAD